MKERKGSMEIDKYYEELLVAWRKKKILNTSDLDTVLSNFRILFAYHSGVIENPEITYHNTREIFENGKIINFTGDIRTVFEIQNQKECYDYLKEKIIEKEPISLDFIKKVHNLLVQGTYDSTRYEKGERPGEFKKHDYVVGDDVGVDPAYVEEELKVLCDDLEAYGKKNVLKAATFFHLQFESIHPFADGNGRVGRTLMNYYLMINDYPPVIIYNEDKGIYYKALEAFDKNDDIIPMWNFLKIEAVKTWAAARHQERRMRQFVEERED